MENQDTKKLQERLPIAASLKKLYYEPSFIRVAKESKKLLECMKKEGLHPQGFYPAWVGVGSSDPHEQHLVFPFMQDFELHRLLEPTFGKATGVVEGKYKRARVFVLESSGFYIFAICETGDRGSGWSLLSKEEGALWLKRGKNQPRPQTKNSTTFLAEKAPKEHQEDLKDALLDLSLITTLNWIKLIHESPSSKHYTQEELKSFPLEKYIKTPIGQKAWALAEANELKAISIQEGVSPLQEDRVKKPRL